MAGKSQIPQWFNDAVKKHETVVQMSTDMEVVKHFVAENTVLLREHTKRFDLIDGKFDMIDRKFDKIDSKFDMIDSKFDMIDRRFNAADARFDQLERMMNLLLEGMSTLNSDIKRLRPLAEDFPELKQRVDFHEKILQKILKNH